MSERMLTITLQSRTRSLLVRHYFSEVPPRVEYELAEVGASMLSALEEFSSWIRETWPRIEACRRPYDEVKR